MKLNYDSIKNDVAWKESGVKLPQFDIAKTVENTEKSPQWIHFGAGNIFRGFVARIAQTLLEKGVCDTGIVAVDTFDFDIIDKIYAPYDNLTLLVRLRADGVMEKEVIAGVAKAYKADCNTEDYKKLIAAFENPSLQMISFTITEKGYALTDSNGEYFSFISADINAGPTAPKTAMGIVCALLLKRFEKGALPLAVCSMDNCSHNGEKLAAGIINMAKEWEKKGFVPKEFLAYLQDESKVSFPWSMIDKITPRPAQEVQDELEKMGIEGMAPIVTSKNTFIAPFVNSEVPEYLVIEDKFPAGRPNLEEGGVFLTDRETVNQVETMKVTTCLNPLHTAMATYGVLLGYDRIFEEMRRKELRALVEKVGYDEGMPVVVDPKIINPKAFIDEVIYQRLSNPFIPDDPKRIATDTSQKVGIRFGETIKAYIKSDELNVTDLTYIPLAIAGWLRYLLAVDDNGDPMPLSSDPMLDELTAQLKGVSLGGEYNGQVMPILQNDKIFGLNLAECGLADKIEGMFKELIAGKGAVSATLTKYLG